MARAGQSVGLYPAEMLGAAFLLWGFLKAGTLKKGADAIKKEKQERQKKQEKNEKKGKSEDTVDDDTNIIPIENKKKMEN